jgi:hypothetical protein
MFEPHSMDQKQLGNCGWVQSAKGEEGVGAGRGGGGGCCSVQQAAGAGHGPPGSTKQAPTWLRACGGSTARRLASYQSRCTSKAANRRDGPKPRPVPHLRHPPNRSTVRPAAVKLLREFPSAQRALGWCARRYYVAKPPKLIWYQRLARLGACTRSIQGCTPQDLTKACETPAAGV